ncbi:hypothetical protein CSPHI_07330 [Corynebacterium sphenisci DSM 44792]|uniref:Uncharacterized protein n=1 Tax=Corynebacterium sphenisci DSM 44792 TaxID=1437874 RepID=A0A1L7CYE0_9CORY|nr:hypothetical protein [Corynebacterium sphenisci]APT90885.1 hypothetical protein CSPHI_07330 [Corynebacterium sphenisci DSM 44792]
MTAITFNVLVLPDEVEQLTDAFRARLDELIAEGRLGSATIDVDSAPEDPQLREQFERQHPGHGVGERVERRWILGLEGVVGSLNATAMNLSKLLTPEAELPPDPVYRQFDDLLEAVSEYPWFLAIEP